MTRLYKRFFAKSLATGDNYQDTVYGNRKKRLFKEITGSILEIGAGTGVNLMYLSPTVQWIGLEPNTYMHRFIYAKAKELDRDVEVKYGYAEKLPFEDASFDAALCTLVLCSVSDPSQALAEIRRVLKPGGTLYFIEHVIAPKGTLLRLLQRTIRPLWQLFADGCRPDRQTTKTLETAGFSNVEIEHFMTAFPIDLLRTHIMGKAIK